MLEKIKLYSLYRKPFEVATEIHGPLYKELLYEESPVGLQSGFVGCCDGEEREAPARGGRWPQDSWCPGHQKPEIRPWNVQ